MLRMGKGSLFKRITYPSSESLVLTRLYFERCPIISQDVNYMVISHRHPMGHGNFESEIQKQGIPEIRESYNCSMNLP